MTDSNFTPAPNAGEQFLTVSPGDSRLAIRDYASTAANWEASNDGPVFLIVGSDASYAARAALAQRWGLPLEAVSSPDAEVRHE